MVAWYCSSYLPSTTSVLPATSGQLASCTSRVWPWSGPQCNASCYLVGAMQRLLPAVLPSLRPRARYAYGVPCLTWHRSLPCRCPRGHIHCCTSAPPATSCLPCASQHALGVVACIGHGEFDGCWSLPLVCLGVQHPVSRRLPTRYANSFGMADMHLSGTARTASLGTTCYVLTWSHVGWAFSTHGSGIDRPDCPSLPSLGAWHSKLGPFTRCALNPVILHLELFPFRTARLSHSTLSQLGRVTGLHKANPATCRTDRTRRRSKAETEGPTLSQRPEARRPNPTTQLPAPPHHGYQATSHCQLDSGRRPVRPAGRQRSRPCWKHRGGPPIPSIGLLGPPPSR